MRLIVEAEAEIEEWEREDVEGRRGELDIVEACLVTWLIWGTESFVGSDAFVYQLAENYDFAPPAPSAVVTLI